MHTKVEERKNDLRNTTVLEVILAVIIILLCVVYIKDTEKKTMEKNHLEQLSELQSENAILKGDIHNLRKENNELKDEVQRLERKIKRYKPKSPGEAGALEKAEQEIVDLEKELKQLRNRLNPEEQKGKGGVDKPSCLIKNGKIEYFADIKKEANLFRFIPTGSTSNKKQVMTVPSASDLLTRGPITLDEFEKFGKIIFNHGQESSPSCVYFVKLDPNKWSGGEIKIIERYFYKTYR